MRLIGFLFLCLTFLAGVTVGTVEYAMINAVIFLLLALVVIKFLEPRFNNNGVVYGMAGAFFVSFLWPYLLILASGDECSGDECLAEGAFQSVPQREQQ